MSQVISLFKTTGQIQDWAKLFPSVEGRKIHGMKITLYTVINIILKVNFATKYSHLYFWPCRWIQKNDHRDTYTNQYTILKDKACKPCKVTTT